MLCIGFAKSAPDEGFVSVERDPSTGFASRSHPLPQGEREFFSLPSFLFYFKALPNDKVSDLH
jgi:hypothetical protein